MDYRELQCTLTLAAELEDQIGSFYNALADVFIRDPKARQFFLLLSYEERTHGHMLRLVRDDIEAGIRVDEADMPQALTRRNGLDQLKLWIHGMEHLIVNSELDLRWALMAAQDLECSELDGVTEWLLALPVPERIRAIVEEMARGAHNHAFRVEQYLMELNLEHHTHVLA